MSKAPRGKLSKYVYVFCVVLMSYASFVFFPRWEHVSSEATISWDVSGYYWYLPSVFIYHDLKHQSFKDGILKKYNPTRTSTDFQQAIRLDNGNYVMKYSSGMAVMFLPFFTVAHFLAGPLGYPRDGFSTPYQLAIQLGGLLVSLLGLWYLRKLLLIFYNDKVVAITLLLLVVGTNYLNYSTIDCGMSHCWLFTIYVFLILNTHYFYDTFKIKYAIRIGLLVGLATLTRPSDLISVLIPLLWGMNNLSIKSITNQFSLYLKNYRSLLVAVVAATCVIFIQLIYWKYATGHWIHYSYEQNQHLYFRSPNFFNYTLSYRTGWLTYCPLMILPFIGIIPFLKNGRNRVAIVAFFLLYYYMVCAWNIWWYGGRAMVQSYPILMFPLAALIEAAAGRKFMFWIFGFIAAFLAYFNIWSTYFYHNGILYDPEITSSAYFWRIIGRWDVPEYVALLKENPDLYEGEPRNSKIVYTNHFDVDTGGQYQINPREKHTALLLTKEHQNSPVYKFPFSDKSVKWLKVTANFRCSGREGNVWNMAQFIVKLTNKGATVKQNMIRVHRVLYDWDTKDVTLFMLLPKSDYDTVEVFFWNGNSERSLWINSIEATSFNEQINR